MKPLSILLFFAIAMWQCQSSDQSAADSSTSQETVTERPGQPTTTALAENSDGPRITFDKVRHHFGSIWHAEKVTYAYTFKNSGTEPLIIKEVKTSCGCTKPTYPKEPIAPGETGEVEVTYNSVGKQGGQRATIRVFTNDAIQPETVLKLLGTVKVKPREEYEKEKAEKSDS